MVAGGTGTRMGSATAKQFLLLAGKPIILHAFEAFHAFDPSAQFILVLYPALREEWNQLAQKYQFTLPHTLVDGGAERFHSVRNGLAALNNDVELVAVHDSVRPLVEQATIARSFAAAEEYGAAVPVVPVTDTIRRQQGALSFTLPRNELVAIQTPQCFQRSILESAYNVDFETTFTDDASVVERNGQYVHLCEGNRANIKVTTPEDLLIGEALMAGRSNL